MNNESIPTREEMIEMKRQDDSTEAWKYLRDTDWYTARLAEKGTPIPDDVLNKRDAARAAIVD